jgi:diaminopimelate epimerase
MKIHFCKYQGCGNDFVILDNREGKYASITKEQVNFICNRRFGVGADGLMMLEKADGYDFKMVYFNADGGESSMCGNGGRCLVNFAFRSGIHKDQFNFIAVDGPHVATLETDGTVNLKMQDVTSVKEESGDFILHTGSPHYVRIVTNVKEENIVEDGRSIRYNKEFEKEGINVNFVEVLDEDGIYVRTYERGVEDETLSCGTGVTASALVNAHNERGFNRVEVTTPGGRLSVEFEKNDEQHFSNIWLCGPAEFVFEGDIEIN